MAARTDQIDELVGWQPGPSAAPNASPIGALAWGVRRASGATGLLAGLWLIHALVENRLASAILQPLRSMAASEAAGASWLPYLLSSARHDPPLYGGPEGYLLQVALRLERPVWSPETYFVLFYGILAGASIAYLHAPRPVPLLAQLGAQCGAYAGRFLRLLLIAAVALWLGMALVTTVSDAVGGDEGAWLATFGVQVLVTGLALTVDFARVRVIARDSRSMLLEAWRSAGFVVRHAPRVLGLMVLLWTLGGVLTLVAVAAANAAAGSAAGPVIEQVHSGARLWVRLAMWAAMLSLYQGIAAERQAAARRAASAG